MGKSRLGLTSSTGESKHRIGRVERDMSRRTRSQIVFGAVGIAIVEGGIWISGPPSEARVVVSIVAAVGLACLMTYQALMLHWLRGKRPPHDG